MPEYSDAVCGYKQSTATVAAVVRIPEYCVKKAADADPADLSGGLHAACWNPMAKDKFGVIHPLFGSTPCSTVVTGVSTDQCLLFPAGNNNDDTAPDLSRGLQLHQ